jgi:hypothetical protein
VLLFCFVPSKKEVIKLVGNRRKVVVSREESTTFDTKKGIHFDYIYREPAFGEPTVFWVGGEQLQKYLEFELE